MIPRRWTPTALVAVLTLLFTALVAAPATAAPAGLPDLVPDADYRACIAAKVGQSDPAEVTEAQLASITELSCTGRSIIDATGTDALPNLTKLFLDNNQLTTVAPLRASTKIFSLGLAGNRLTDVAALGDLTALTSVNLAGNRLRDVSVLGTLPGFSSISGTRHGQQATAPGAFAGTATLVPDVIGTRGNLVTPTTPAGATVSGSTVTYGAPGTYEWTFRDDNDFSFNGKVTVEVAAASATTVPDDALRACVNTKLGLAADAQPTVAQLGAATGSLSCVRKDVTDLRGLDLMTGLTNVNLLGNAIADVRPLAALTNVTILDIAQNEVSSIAALGTLPKLGTLRVNQTGVSTKAKLRSLAGVQRLTGLTALTVNYSALTSLAPLAGHPTLKTLNATDNAITDVTPLATANALTSLDLTNNQVSDLSPLQGRSIPTLKVLTQKLTAPEATATVEGPAPRVVAQDGTTLVATPPAGVTVTGGQVTYAEPGTYTWTFTNARPPLGATFSGSLTQRVAPAPAQEHEVAVPDAGLRACLAAALGQPAADPLTEEQLATLATLSCVDRDIADLTGAEHLTSVTDLVLSTNAITDLTPLAGLTTLTKLMLPGNAITDVSPLAGLTQLATLNLSYNALDSIAALATLTALTDLEVTQRAPGAGGSQGLTSLSGVESMTALTRLVVNNSRLTDLTPVAGLTALERLFVSGNQISDLAPVRHLTALTGFGANTNKITDVSPLAGLTHLTSLDVATNQITDVSALSTLTNLGFLGLKARWQAATLPGVRAQMTVSAPNPRALPGDAVTLTAPAGITVAGGTVRYPAEGDYAWSFSARSADGEYFSGTLTQPVTAPVSGVADLPDSGLRACLAQAAGLPASTPPTEADLASVTTADCHDRGIADLTGADLLTSVVDLDLSGNPLTGLAPLGGLTTLTRLDLGATGLTTVDAVAGLTALTRLVLDDNGVRDLTPLAGLDDLAELSATGQRLTLPDTPGGVAVAAPAARAIDGSPVVATVPAGATPVDGGARFDVAGAYQWPFTAGTVGGTFSGEFAQRATSDLVDPGAHDGAAACVAADHVWVVVERDTGLQQGGCATQFGTGLEALTSAGFDVTGSSFITRIDGYPSASAGAAYWSYWHADKPAPVDDTLSYTWAYSQLAAPNYAPKPGSIEGWRFGDGTAPSWRPALPAAGTPTTPTVTPTPTPTTAPTPTATPGATTLTVAGTKVAYGRKATVVVRVQGGAVGQVSGTVTGTVGGTTVTGTIAAGHARLVIPARRVKPGRHAVRIGYAGSATAAPAETTGTLRVVKAKPRLRVTTREARRGHVRLRISVQATGVTPRGAVVVTLAGHKHRARLNARGVAIVVAPAPARPRARVTVRYAGSPLVKQRTATHTVRLP